jgi:hypothetical protein
MHCNQRLKHLQSRRRIAAGASRDAQQQRCQRMIRRCLENFAGLLRRKRGVALQ